MLLFLNFMMRIFREISRVISWKFGGKFLLIFLQLMENFLVVFK